MPPSPDKGRPVQAPALPARRKPETVEMWLDADVLAALRASGEGWQTRVNSMLRAGLALAGRLK